MLNKTILVFYMDVTNMSPQDISEYVENIKKSTKLKDEDENEVIKFFIPIRGEKSRVECLNVPTFIIGEQEKKKFQSQLNYIDNKLDRITSYFNAKTESRKTIIEKL